MNLVNVRRHAYVTILFVPDVTDTTKRSLMYSPCVYSLISGVVCMYA